MRMFSSDISEKRYLQSAKSACQFFFNRRKNLPSVGFCLICLFVKGNIVGKNYKCYAWIKKAFIYEQLRTYMHPMHSGQKKYTNATNFVNCYLYDNNVSSCRRWSTGLLDDPNVWNF